MPRLLILVPALQRERQGEFVHLLDANSKTRHTPMRCDLRVAEAHCQLIISTSAEPN